MKKLKVECDGRILYGLSAEEGGEQNFVCERHPDRILGPHPAVYTAEVRDPENGDWIIHLTPDGWTIGDCKIMIALCPDCSSKAYKLPWGEICFKEKGRNPWLVPGSKPCIHCQGPTASSEANGDSYCMNPSCFSFGS